MFWYVIHQDGLPVGILEPHIVRIVETISEGHVSSSDSGMNPRRIVALSEKLNVYSDATLIRLARLACLVPFFSILPLFMKGVSLSCLLLKFLGK